jgi:membrane-bound lytic murein transglycosylase D
MKKLLLLTAILIAGEHYTSAKQMQHIDLNLPKDSSIDEIAVNPREGFKNLFETTSATNGMNVRLNPQAVSFVQDYMERHSSFLNRMKGWGRPYFDMMNSVLKQHGLPTELKYLSVIESDLQSDAVSWAGAVGPWQLMPGTARDLGLRVDRGADERTDFYKSTHAAARYLTDLYGLFGDWLLVIAAYNGGPGNVYSAIRKSGSRNFWQLQYYLPEESRNHVKKFIATHYIMEGTGGVTTLTKSEARDAIFTAPAKGNASGNENTSTLTVSGKYSSIVIAQNLNMALTEFNQLNPGFDKILSSTDSYELRLPNDKMLQFQARKPQILEQSIQLMLTTGMN